jgi:hypothetical protein
VLLNQQPCFFHQHVSVHGPYFCFPLCLEYKQSIFQLNPLIMKRQSLFLLLLLVLSCRPDTTGDRTSILSSPLPPYPLEVPEQHAVMTKWAAKPVLDSRLIDDMEADGNWQKTGIGEMSYTEERAHDGRRALRFRTSMRDEEHYRRNRSAWNSFNGSQGGNTSVQLYFDGPQDWTAFNRISFWIYVHPTSMPTYGIYLNMVCTGAPSNATAIRGSHFVHDLKPGEWNQVLFEIPHLKRDSVTSFGIYQMLRGHNPEEEGIVTYDIDQLEIQRVETDVYEGWEVVPGMISYCHTGYRPDDPKLAWVGDGGAAKFELIDSRGKTVFSGNVTVEENKQGVFRVLDFSDFRRSGEYRLRCGEIESGLFPISPDVWLQPLFKAINAYFCLRCGYHVPGIHLECHKDWQGFHGDVKKVINGGWHDAGDLSQGSWRTAMAALVMMRHLELLETRDAEPELRDRLREEIAWGLNWLLKTRFGDGFHMSFSVMRIYTDNEIGTIDDVVSPAANVPWENFLAAAVQAKAALLLRDTHPELAADSRTAAIEDWQAAVNSREEWEEADYREAAWGAASSIQLQQLTGDESYATHAHRFGRLLMLCQEQRFVEGIPIAGYFYTRTDRQDRIHNFHAAFEEAPLIALAALCDYYPDHPDWMDWYGAAVLHSEYFQKRGSVLTAPYRHLPNSVWHISEPDNVTVRRAGYVNDPVKEAQMRKDMVAQIAEGIPLGKDYYLRTFPVYHDDLFHGNTNIQLSGAWALAEAARLRGDADGMQLVGKQLEWVLGANPFGQSLMYGVGYNFAPHFAYCLKNIVGSLPVGMDCHSGDQPHWSATNNATFKEIWVEPASRFLGALSLYLQPMPAGDVPPTGRKQQIQVTAGPPVRDGNSVLIVLTVQGNGPATLGIKAFNAQTALEQTEFELSGSRPSTTELRLTVEDAAKPYVVLVQASVDPETRCEITGSFIEPSWK